MRKSVLLFLLLITAIPVLAYNNLRVLDPQMQWRNDRGTIEEAFISVNPQGIFMEVGLYLTFSARNTNYQSHSDTLEIEMDFDLPEGAVVSDLWLWVGEDIMRGLILDKWRASEIYEGIVNRRKDPALLTKNGNNQYELRVFPMAGDETRRVKITYLVPTQWNAESITGELPTDILSQSKTPIPKINVLFKHNDTWDTPKVLGYDNIEFKIEKDDENNDILLAEIPSDAVNSMLYLDMNNPMENTNGVFVKKYAYGDGGYYQMAFLPSQALDLNTQKKAAVLIDYDLLKTTVSKDVLLETIKSSLQVGLAASDSFNVFLSNLDIEPYNETWMPANFDKIEEVFADISSGELASYSNLPQLINKGIDYIKNHGNDGSLVLYASSDNVGDVEVANQLIDDLVEKMDPVLPLHVVDITNKNYNLYNIGNRLFAGNEYFYINISRMTTGNYEDIRNDGGLETISNNIFTNLGSFLSTFDLHTSLSNGFCYSRYYFNEELNIYLDRPILQIGKYIGDFPFVIQASGVFEDQPFSENIFVDDQNPTVVKSDSLLEDMWTGKYIEYLSGRQQTNEVITEIIDYSIEERILSNYTAFLALEPGDSLDPCFDCDDETNVVDVEDFEEAEAVDSLFAQAYPNPFNPETTINVNLPQGVTAADASFQIFNILGQLVKSYNPAVFGDKRRLEIRWNGKNDNGSRVSSGVYLFVVTTPQTRHSLKLLMLK